ncbi:serine hydrolase domain-containing protein [Fodinicola acaciae]|uniref:serine hydrolase domain-containing protein n=1 Tax=Fodinicola acaciae TaxID=2681555 RepID=UPI0013D0823E|nr:serine hydrolase domain-containing protein [Fodinicola acaciae]
MNGLEKLLDRYVAEQAFPGAVALVARGDRTEVAAVGSVDVDGSAPMRPDSIFRVASITKTVVAAAVMMLVEDGRLTLEDTVEAWLPEIARPRVVRTPQSPIDDVVPARRAITVDDLLTSRAGYGWPSDFTYPAVQALFPVQRDGRQPRTYPTADEWMAELAGVPALHQPGEAWLYDTCSTLQGVLISRVTGQSLADFLAERLFEPLAMADTGFHVPATKRDRMTSYYQPDATGRPRLADGPDGQWSTPPAFPLGHGGLVSTATDWAAFTRMLVAGGERLLSAESVRQLTTDHLSAGQREGGRLFLDGQGWGFGGSVDVDAAEPWRIPGRYGWVGGTGTCAHVIPSTGTTAVLLTQRGAVSPDATPSWLTDFWTYAARFPATD